MRATYAVATRRDAASTRYAPQVELVVSKYRGLDEPLDDVAEYTELDEVALDRRRRSLCTTPEVSEAVSEDPPPTPPPRASVSSGTYDAPPPPGAGRAPADLPAAQDDDDEEAAVGGSGVSAPSTSRRPERTISNPEVILEEEEGEIDDNYDENVGDRGGDEYPDDIYSEVIEDEDLYVTVPGDWNVDGDGDGATSLGSSRSSVWTACSATPVPAARPYRPPAQVIVIRENENCTGGGTLAVDADGVLGPRPPDDLPDERPVPRLYVQCLPCCLTGEAGLAGGAVGKARVVGTPGYRMLALALLLFAFLVMFLLLILADLIRTEKSSSVASSTHSTNGFQSTTASAELPQNMNKIRGS